MNNNFTTIQTDVFETKSDMPKALPVSLEDATSLLDLEVLDFLGLRSSDTMFDSAALVATVISERASSATLSAVLLAVSETAKFSARSSVFLIFPIVEEVFGTSSVCFSCSWDFLFLVCGMH